MKTDISSTIIISLVIPLIVLVASYFTCFFTCETWSARTLWSTGIVCGMSVVLFFISLFFSDEKNGVTSRGVCVSVAFFCLMAGGAGFAFSFLWYLFRYGDSFEMMGSLGAAIIVLGGSFFIAHIVSGRLLVQKKYVLLILFLHSAFFAALLMLGF